jgi:hypothetical protein
MTMALSTFCVLGLFGITIPATRIGIAMEFSSNQDWRMRRVSSSSGLFFFAFILHLLLCSLGDREWVMGMWWVGLSIHTLYQKGSLLFPFRQSERGRSH